MNRRHIGYRTLRTRRRNRSVRRLKGLPQTISATFGPGLLLLPHHLLPLRPHLLPLSLLETFPRIRLDDLGILKHLLPHPLLRNPVVNDRLPCCPLFLDTQLLRLEGRPKAEVAVEEVREKEGDNDEENGAEGDAYD